MEKIELAAAKRTVFGKKNRVLREEGRIPAVLYGHGAKNEPLELDAKATQRVYRQAGRNKIVGLKVGEGRAKNVMIHQVQREASRGELTHVDFYVVKMDEEIRAAVPLKFVGESVAVYQQDGTLVKNLDVVEIEALPGEMPELIEVDISVLDDFDKAILMKDLHVPGTVRLVEENLDKMVARVEPPRSEEEMAALEEPVDEAGEMPAEAKETQEEAAEPVVEENEGQKDR